MKSFYIWGFLMILFKGLPAQEYKGLSTQEYKGVSTQEVKTIINGKVLNESSVNIKGASISIFSMADQLILKTVSDSAGKFSIAKPKHPFYLYVSHIGYIPYKMDKISSDTLIIVLKNEGKQLNEVNITTVKPFIQQEADKMVINIDGNPKAGMNVVDILKKIPGVLVKNENEITVEGKGVMVLIDGKPSRLSGSSLISLLNGTPSTDVGQLEVIYNPSAKYDAEGSGGIINIKTLKRKVGGYDANVSLTGGHGWKHPFGSSSVGLNYKKGNTNIYTSYSVSTGKQYQEIGTNSFQYDLDQKLEEFSIYSSRYNSNNFRFGLDQSLNKNDVLGFLLTGNYNKRNPNYTVDAAAYQLADAQQRSSSFSENLNTTISKGVNMNINYRHLINEKKQKEITVDADAGVFNYHNDNHTSLLKRVYIPVDKRNEELLMQEGKTTTQIYSLKVDYSQKLSKGLFETGLKLSHVNIDNDFLSSGDTEIVINPTGNSNTFLYQESILAGYANMKVNSGKFTFQLGLRGEETFTKGNSITLQQELNRDYFNLFPNISAGLKSGRNSFSLSYSRRIGRPSYSALNPFVIVRSPYLIDKGNPNLNPSFTDNLRLGYSLNNKFMFSTSYSYSKDVITDFKIRDDNSVVISNSKFNLGAYRNIGFNLSYNNNFFKFLQINYGLSVSNSRYRFAYDNAPEEVKQTTAALNLGNTFNISETMWAEIYFYGQSRVTYGSQVNLPFSLTSVSAGKKMMKGKGNLSLSISDLFFTGITRSEANYGNMDYNLRSRYDSRNFRLNFSYRFGNTKIDTKRRTAGSEEEQRRNTAP